MNAIVLAADVVAQLDRLLGDFQATLEVLGAVLPLIDEASLPEALRTAAPGIRSELPLVGHNVEELRASLARSQRHIGNMRNTLTLKKGVR
jgi:hypothetical protein